MVRRDCLTFMLTQAPAHAELVPNWRVVDKMWDVYFWFSADDVRARHAELRERGAIIDYELEMPRFPWAPLW